jgi:hypothetical protein
MRNAYITDIKNQCGRPFCPDLPLSELTFPLRGRPLWKPLYQIISHLFTDQNNKANNY